MNEPDYAEALRLIREYKQPGDTIGKMFIRVAKALEATESGEVCIGCGKVLICRHCGRLRSGSGDRKEFATNSLQPGWMGDIGGTPYGPSDR